jgi:hypothetical protein
MAPLADKPRHGYRLDALAAARIVVEAADPREVPTR